MSIKERIADAVDFSKDIILNSALIKLTGNTELSIENYKGILEYSTTVIRIKAKPKTIKICGKNLEFKTITDEVLLISGIFSQIEFVED